VTSGKSKGSCLGGEINRLGEETLNRSGVAELSTVSMWQETAAMRDVSPAYVGSGSFASKVAEAVRPCTSAAPPKADVNLPPWLPPLSARS
jgi:hypothetical protein